MELQIVSIETAILLKEIGFDLETDKVWYDSYHYPEGMLHNKASLLWKDALTTLQQDFPQYQFPAPTQELLKKWLRDVHNLICEVRYKFTHETTNLDHYETIIFCDIDEHDDYPEVFDYEVGLERTLFEACVYVKNKLNKTDANKIQ